MFGLSLRGLFQPKLFCDHESCPLLWLLLPCHCMRESAVEDFFQLRLNLQNMWVMFVGLNCGPVKDEKTGRKLETAEKITDYSSKTILG